VKRNGKQLLSLLAPCLLLSTGGPALVHRVTRDTCVDKPETTRDAISTDPTEQQPQPLGQRKQNEKQMTVKELYPWWLWRYRVSPAALLRLLVSQRRPWSGWVSTGRGDQKSWASSYIGAAAAG